VALVMAAFLIGSAPALIPPGLIPAGVTVSLSPFVAAFTLLVSITTGILFGMAPALAATRPDVQETLQDASRGSTGGRGGQRFRQVMVVAEVAVALILLAGASLMTQSFRKLADINLGFDPKRVLTARLVLPAARYDAERSWLLQDQFLSRISSMNGVEGAAVASTAPLAWIGMEVPFDLETAPPKDQAQRPGVRYVTISDGFFRTLNTPLVRGRDFNAEDRGPAPKSVIVNQAFAARYFPKQDPVGQRIILNNPLLGKTAFSEDTRPEIVGLIPNIRMNDPAAAPEPVLYVPQANNVWTSSSWFIVRTRMDAASLSSALRREMAELEKNQPVDPAASLEQMFEDQFAQPRFQSVVMGVFAMIALVLATVGIYGINAYAVAQRKREIGVRMALGASPGSVVMDSVLRGMAWTGAGIAAGLLGAALLGPAIRSVIVGVGPSDALTIGASAGFLLVVAILACLVPAWRATRIDPATALRQE
jgi:putative ABC transport system permease protein